MIKLNCWESLKCGHQPYGHNVNRRGVCPATTEISHDGINNGTCAGRSCWRITGTLCKNMSQRTYVEKLEDCIRCPFFMRTQEEEGPNFVM